MEYYSVQETAFLFQDLFGIKRFLKITKKKSLKNTFFFLFLKTFIELNGIKLMLDSRSSLLIYLCVAYSDMLLWNIISSIFMAEAIETHRQLQQRQKIPIEET